MKDWLYKLFNWLGRKFLALILCLVILLISGKFTPDKLSTISLAITGLYTVFVSGHAATDIMNTNKTTTTKTDVSVKVEDKKEVKEEAD